MKRFFTAGICVILAGCGSLQEIPTTQDSNPKNMESVAENKGAPVTGVSGKATAVELAVAQIHSKKYEGSLLLEFEEGLELQIKNGRLVSAKKTDPAVEGVNGILENYTDLQVTGAVGEELARVRNNTARIQKLSGEKLADLSKYIELKVSDPKRAEKVLRELWKEKEKGLVKVWAKIKLRETGVVAGGESFFNFQGYLGAPDQGNYGLNIRNFWDRFNNKGEGAVYTLIETGWNSQHEDLQIPIFSPVVVAHGTAMLGIVSGAHDNGGIDGIAPHARSLPRSGGWSPPRGQLGTVINYSAGLCGPGGNIPRCQNGGSDLGEVTNEAARFFFDAYKEATASGYVVVDGAGNGSVSLDDPQNLWEDSPDWSLDEEGNYREDSGVIIVGASIAGTLEKAAWSTCGGRVDLFAWGTDVVTTSYPDSLNLGWVGEGYQNDADRPNEYYTNRFGGTSAASAIITGMATLLQSHAKSRMGAHKFLTSKRIRDLLVRSGIPGENDGGCPIGVLPNMVRAAELFDVFWNDLQARYPVLANGGTIFGEERRRLYQEEGVGLECKLYDINYESSDPQCPEYSQCRVRRPFDGNETSVAHLAESFDHTHSLFLDVEGSDYDCVAGAIWPSGLIHGKLLDFDADGRSDLVNNTTERIQIDLSSRNDFGAWDLDLEFPDFDSPTVWPVMEDYDSDGRVDIGMFDKKTGRSFIRYTDKALLEGGSFGEWDRVIEYPFRDIPSRDIFSYVYVRPVFGDYNGDHYVDVAFALRGRLEIDYGGPYHNGLGAIDEPRRLQYLSEEQMRAAPDWAYLPMYSSGDLIYKVPDQLADVGKIGYLRIEENSSRLSRRSIGGGNDVIPVSNLFPGSDDFKYNNGMWWNDTFEYWPEPNGIFGGLECHPLIAEFDGNDKEDRAVQCPGEFRVVLSEDSRGNGELITYPLGYDTTKFSLPGRSYVGGLSYQTVLRLIDYQLNSSNEFPVIPVDMAGPGICAIPWGDDPPAECR